MPDPNESSSSAAADAAAMYLAASGLASGSGLNESGKGGQQKKKDNKMKKKKGAAGDHETKGKEKQSAMGKAIAERLAKQREDKEKIRLEVGEGSVIDNVRLWCILAFCLSRIKVTELISGCHYPCTGHNSINQGFSGVVT